MTTNAVAEFNKLPSGAYDEKNKKLAPISKNLHFLTELVLKELPTDARILCVGVGTGAEILSLARAYPGWTFDGIDPAASMLDDCRKRLDEEGLLSRCELFHGYLSEFNSSEEYDAVVCLLVMHFVRDLEVRTNMFQEMASHLKPKGTLVNAEISYDLNDSRFPDILEKWKQVQFLLGATPESLSQLHAMLREGLLLLPPEQTASLIQKSGFSEAILFFQSFLLHAWYAQKK